MRLPQPFIASLVSLVFILPFALYVMHAPSSFESGFLIAGNAFAHGGSFPASGEYPPGVSLIYAFFSMLFGPVSVPFAVIIQALTFAKGSGYWFATLKRFFPNPKQHWLTWTASLLNPYFLWLAVTSKDTAFEWVGVSIFFYCLTELIATTKDASRKRILLSTALVVAFSFSMMMRVTTVFVLIGALVVALLMHWRTMRKQLLLIGAVCGVLVGAYVLHNGQVYGTYSLSSATKGNIAYGQSPLYEYAHPLHDIDVFLPMDAFNGPVVMPTPITFLAVSVRKSVWYWFNFEKIPNLSSNTRLINQTGNILTISIEPVNHVPALLYTLMKLIYLPAFLISLYLYIRRRHWTDPTIVFLAPLLFLWPVCVLTFPDTRFKIVGEVMAVAFIVYQFSKELTAKI